MFKYHKTDCEMIHYLKPMQSSFQVFARTTTLNTLLRFHTTTTLNAFNLKLIEHQDSQDCVQIQNLKPIKSSTQVHRL